YLPQISTCPRSTRKSTVVRAAEPYAKSEPAGGDILPGKVEHNADASSAAIGHGQSESLQSGRLVNEVGDDRDAIGLGDSVILIVENDLAFARFLLDAAREKGF